MAPRAGCVCPAWRMACCTASPPPPRVGYNRRVLALKLTLVPLFLLAVSLAARRWGPRVAGLLAGLPVVAGPILFFIAIENGARFGADAAGAALAGVLGAVAFNLGYAHLALRGHWPAALAVGLGAWALGTALVLQLPEGLGWSAAAALLALLLGPALSPRVRAVLQGRPSDTAELALRMAAGALLTLAVTLVAASVGSRWSGLLAVFPLLSTVLAVSSHRRQGATFIAALLRSMLLGFVAFAAFCATLAWALPQLPLAAAFGAALATCALVQGAMVVLAHHRFRHRGAIG